MTMQLLLATAGWLIGWYLLWRVPSVPPVGGPAPDYAAIIPARNEAFNIGSLVEKLVRQDLPPAEIVVVDDGSIDATAEIAEAAGAHVIRNEELPAGWLGKNWACHVGAGATTAPLLVFLDADVRVGPSALGAVAKASVSQPGLLSVVPFHTVRRRYEWLSLFFGIVSVMGVGMASMRRGRISGAFGPCLAMSRVDYLRIGGHAAVAGDVVDDMALAAETHRAGLPVRVFGGGPDITYRMYPNGPAALIEGWTKNIASGAGRIPVVRSLAVGLWVAGAVSSLLVTVSNPVLGAVLMVAWMLQLSHHARQLGSFPLASIGSYPALLLGFCIVFARSAVLTAFGRPVRWRGRQVPSRPSVSGAGR